MTEIIGSSSYRAAIAGRLRQLKLASEGRLTAARMAEACRVAPPFLSAVFAERSHLSADQLFAASSFLGLTNLESEYLRLQSQMEQSTLRDRKSVLKVELENIIKQHQRAASEVSAKQHRVESLVWQDYFLNPEHQLVHMAMTLDEFRKHPAKLGPALQLSEQQIEHSLRLLLEIGCLESSDVGYQIRQNALHLDDNSPIEGAYLRMMRLLALRLPAGRDKKQFSVLFSCDQATGEWVKSELNRLVRKIGERVNRSREVKLFQLNFDFLNWL